MFECLQYFIHNGNLIYILKLKLEIYIVFYFVILKYKYIFLPYFQYTNKSKLALLSVVTRQLIIELIIKLIVND